MATYFQKGDGLKGEKISFQCRDYHVDSKPIASTSRDKAQKGKLEGTVYCVIDKPVLSLHKRISHID